MTLTETASFTKKAFIFGIIFLVFSGIFFAGYQYWYNKIYLPNLPIKEERPDNKFGALPKLKFPLNSISSSNYAYTLDTETGSLPVNIPKLVKVYPVIPLSTDLLALDRAKALADKLDFKNGPEMLSSTQYRFTDQFDGELLIDLDTGNFKYTHHESSESAALQANSQFLEDDRLNSDFKSFLSSKNLLKDQLQGGRTQAPVFEKAIKNESTFATLSIWQNDVDKFPIITPLFKLGLIKATITKSADEIYRFRALTYTYWPIDLENPSTYPIITPDEAFSLLKNGEASVLIEPASAKASITRVYLGYFLSDEYLPYLQPVYVFEGNQFVALVAAINPDLIEK